MELEAQVRRHIGVGRLLVRQRDVQRHRGCAHVVGTARGGFHDAGAAARADVKAFARREAQAVGRHQPGKLARQFVVTGISHAPFGLRHGPGIAAGPRGGQRGLGSFGGWKACAAEYDDGVLDTRLGLVQVGLEHFELDAQAARLAPQKELGIGKGQPVGVGLQRQPFGGVRLQLRPGVGQVAVLDVFCGFHAFSGCWGLARAARPGSEGPPPLKKAPCGALSGGGLYLIRRACGIRRCACRFRSCRPGRRTGAPALRNRWRSWRA